MSRFSQRSLFVPFRLFVGFIERILFVVGVLPQVMCLPVQR